MERTLVLLKPDTVQRRLMGRIIDRFEQRGIQIIGCKMLMISPELASRHYAEHVGKPYYAGLLEFITSGPVVALCLKGEGVVGLVRAMMGATDCSEAAAGTIRGDFGTRQRFNLVHGSDSAESAERELALYFEEEELVDYDPNRAFWLP